MPSLQELKNSIGGLYPHIENVTDKQVGEAMAMPLVDQWRKDKYFYRILPLKELAADCKIFQEKGLQISPFDVWDIIFHAKLLFATTTEKEFIQRTGGGLAFLKDSAFRFVWAENKTSYDEVLDRHLQVLDSSIEERTLASQISGFRCFEGDLRNFFEELFVKLDAPFTCYLEDAVLEAKLKELQPGRREYTPDMAKQYFSSPAIGFTTVGTQYYAYWYASAWLRSFLNFLRISAFINYGQIDFGWSGIEFQAPLTPIFLGAGTLGVFSWKEDAKEPWAKIPDGCLFRSFGYRGLSTMSLDIRTFRGIQDFFLQNKKVFDLLKNPWKKECLEDMAPSLDILSAATQTPDLGAKTLLLYCCLEHLFVPKSTKDDNVKYIIGGIHALKPNLIPWFERLYKVRCQYAHKGYVITDNDTLQLVFESTRNVAQLMAAKLTLS